MNFWCQNINQHDRTFDILEVGNKNHWKLKA